MQQPDSSVSLVQKHLCHEFDRAKQNLKSDQWEAILVGVSDEGEIAVYPCQLLMPFHYPATAKQLDKLGPDHFKFHRKIWELNFLEVPEFAEQNAAYCELEDEAESLKAEATQIQRRIAVLQEACATLKPSFPVFGITSDSEEWWEVNTFHIAGPRIPPPPTPVSDIQLLTRLCRHTHSYIGKSRFTMRGDVITEVSFDGADTTDATIDLLRGIPNLKELLKGLLKVSLQSTLVSQRSLKFLKRELPHVAIDYSHYLKG